MTPETRTPDRFTFLRADASLGLPTARQEIRSASERAVPRMAFLQKGVFWPRERFPDESGTLGMLLLDGIILRGVAVTDRPTVEVLGPGDVFRPFDLQRAPEPLVSCEERWWALRPARVAVLDGDFMRHAASHPCVVAELAGRLSRRSAASSLRLAIAPEPRLAVRLHRLLWQLADRFGEVGTEGMVLPLPLCHVLLAWLAGARRPAMSRAVNELERDGLLARRPDDTWWLGRQPPAGLGETARLLSVAA